MFISIFKKQNKNKPLIINKFLKTSWNLVILLISQKLFVSLGLKRDTALVLMAQVKEWCHGLNRLIVVLLCVGIKGVLTLGIVTLYRA